MADDKERMMNRLARLAALFSLPWLTVTTADSWATDGAEAELVEVHVRSGRTFAGRVDERSDDARLWLRFQMGSTTLWRPIDWSRVVSVMRDGRALSKQEALAMASEAPARPQRNEAAVVPGRVTMAEAARQTLEAVPTVRSVEFTARLGNWNPGVVDDGLVVDLQTLALDGSLVPVGGTVEISFDVTRYRTPRSGAHRHGREVRRLGHWTRTFTAEEMADGLRMELPFGPSHPAWDRSWAPYGVVTVRVVVPGHGVFTRSHDFVRTRPFSPTRDRRFRVSGSPRLPAER